MAKRGIGHITDDKPVMSDEVKAEVFNKTIRGIPTKLKDEFDRLKGLGKVHGSLNSYIVYALAQQLERDG
ncbi:Antitoxin [Vibrio crassostreae]|nr:Antitoxin [Vibrio crassostreae]